MVVRSLASVLLLALAAYPSELTYRPVSVTLVPPVSTYGTDGANTVSDVSINILGGYIGSVRAFELGGIANIVRFDLRGGQIAGVMNVVQGGVRGGQLAPVNVAGSLHGVQLGSININRGGLRGVQAGNINVTRGELRGVQAGNVNVGRGDVRGVQAGNVNVIRGEVRGVQAGNVNVGRGDVRGVQAGNVNVSGDLRGVQAGNVNLSGDFHGAQLGNVNVTGDFRGAQVGNVNLSGGFDGIKVGNVNIAGSGRGFMLGNVNICSHLDGEALGNISIIGNGYRAYTAWTDETGTGQLGVKLGSRRIYNVFGVGVAALADPGPRWLLAWGLGGHLPLRDDRFFVDLDAVAHIVSDPASLRRSRGEHLLRLRPQFGVNLHRRVSVVAGPVFSLRITDEPADDRLTPIPVGLFEGWLRQDRNWYQAWTGLMAGLQLN